MATKAKVRMRPEKRRAKKSLFLAGLGAVGAGLAGALDGWSEAAAVAVSGAGSVMEVLSVGGDWPAAADWRRVRPMVGGLGGGAWVRFPVGWGFEA